MRLPAFYDHLKWLKELPPKHDNLPSPSLPKRISNWIMSAYFEVKPELAVQNSKCLDNKGTSSPADPALCRSWSGIPKTSCFKGFRSTPHSGYAIVPIIMAISKAFVAVEALVLIKRWNVHHWVKYRNHLLLENNNNNTKNIDKTSKNNEWMIALTTTTTRGTD